MGRGVHRETLLDLLTSHGGPGFEEAVAAKVKAAFAAYSEDIRTDALGNVIARVHPSVRNDGAESVPSILLSAHMDEIALLVTHIEPGGFLRVAQTGGFDPRTLVGQEVMVHGTEPMLGIIGHKPPHITPPEERKKASPLEDLYIDLAMSEERVRQQVQIGDRVTVARQPMELLNNRLSGKSLDNRTSVAILLECLEALKTMKHGAEVYAVASVQEEVGIRGATTLGYGLQPDVAIAVDVTFADMPGQDPDESFQIGQGPAVSFGPNIHPKVFEGLRDTAERFHIPYQLELSQGPTGTDGRAFQIAGTGIATGVVGIPIRYMHCSVETGSYEDIVDCAYLLAHYIVSLTSEKVEGLSCY